jgi:hypothetical protein
VSFMTAKGSLGCRASAYAMCKLDALCNIDAMCNLDAVCAPEGAVASAV